MAYNSELILFQEFLPLRMCAQQLFSKVSFTVVVYRTWSNELTFGRMSACQDARTGSRPHAHDTALVMAEHVGWQGEDGGTGPPRCGYMYISTYICLHNTPHSSWRSMWGGRKKMEGLGHRGVVICIYQHTYIYRTHRKRHGGACGVAGIRTEVRLFIHD